MTKKLAAQTPAKSLRPIPRAEAFDDIFGCFVPAPEVYDWIREQILEETGPLHNPAHKHLLYADINILWTTVPGRSKGLEILGQAEMPMPRGAAWQKAKIEQQMREWFGRTPDYLLTFYAPYCLECTDAEFAALVEHELYHCAQELDEFGQPAFKKDGSPKLTIRGHDVEEFIGVVERYGIGDSEGSLAKLVEAAQKKPSVSGVNIARACGTCMLKVV